MANYKEAPIKVNENGTYVDIAPITYANIVYLNESRNGTVSSKLNDLENNLNTTTNTANAAVRLVVSATQPAAPATNILWIKP